MEDEKKEEVSNKDFSCEVKTIDGEEVLVTSDGQIFNFKVAGCGEAIRITDYNDDYVTEIPTSVHGCVMKADVEVITAAIKTITKK